MDSQHLIVAAMEQAFDAVRRPPPPRNAILGVVGLSLPESIWRLAADAGEETVMKIADGYKDAFGLLRQDPNHWEPMYEGAHDAIVNLAKDETCVLGIATGKSQRGVVRLLERYELTSYFETIQTADDAPSKPHPGMIHQALEETGAEPHMAIMIGDTTFDMAMARNAGVTALGVSWGYHPVEDLHDEGAHGVADDYAHLMDLLGDHFGKQAVK